MATFPTGAREVMTAAALFVVLGAALAIVNREATDMDTFADLVLHDEIGPVLTEIVPALA